MEWTVLLLRTVNCEFKILQNCSKNLFEAKGRRNIPQVIQRLFNIDL